MIGAHGTGVEREEGLAGVPEGAGVPRATQASFPLPWPLGQHFLPRTAGAETRWGRWCKAGPSGDRLSASPHPQARGQRLGRWDQVLGPSPAPAPLPPVLVGLTHSGLLLS